MISPLSYLLLRISNEGDAKRSFHMQMSHNKLIKLLTGLRKMALRPAYDTTRMELSPRAFGT